MTVTTLSAPLGRRSVPREPGRPVRTAYKAACSTRGCCGPRLPDALRKLNPATLCKNPVMFIVEIGAVFTTVIAIANPSVFAWLIVVWLWLTVLFANLAEAVAEGRGKAQADALRRAKTDTVARRLVDRDDFTGGRGAGARRRSCSRATASSAKPATSSPATATSSTASPASTSRRSPARARR